MLCWFDQYKRYQRLVYEIFLKRTLTTKRIKIFLMTIKKCEEHTIGFLIRYHPVVIKTVL